MEVSFLTLPKAAKVGFNSIGEKITVQLKWNECLPRIKMFAIITYMDLGEAKYREF